MYKHKIIAQLVNSILYNGLWLVSRSVHFTQLWKPFLNLSVGVRNQESLLFCYATAILSVPSQVTSIKHLAVINNNIDTTEG
jgi:hypothetical protein